MLMGIKNSIIYVFVVFLIKIKKKIKTKTNNLKV